MFIYEKAALCAKICNRKKMPAAACFFFKPCLKIKGISLFIAKTKGMMLDKREAKNKSLNIAIDGPAGAGKSTVAREVARQMGIDYLDTGAMYRAVTFCLIQNRVDLGDQDAVDAVLHRIRLDLKTGAKEIEVYLNGEDISAQLRTANVNKLVSQVSAISSVRHRMVALQQSIASRSRGIVIEGRDIASRVIPGARFKFYLDADLSERARRRWAELNAAGRKVSLKEVQAEIAERDRLDSERQDSPLAITPGAHVIDTTNLSFEEVVRAILKLVQETGREVGEG